jgi:PqqD family protein of HPr-rel-A system
MGELDKAASRPRTRADLVVVELDGESVIYEERSGNVHHLNPSASLVFSLLDGEATLTELAQEIAAAFGLENEEVDRQVRTLVAGFREQGLLEEAPVRTDGASGD